MGALSHIRIPEERHPTGAAAAALSARLGFVDNDAFQDWERHFADPSRLAEFARLLRARDLDADECFLLMELTLASAAEAEPAQLPDGLWQEIAHILVSNYVAHAWSVWFWASIDEATGIALNDFSISQKLQHILSIVDDRRRHPDGTIVVPVVPDFSAFWAAHYDGHHPVGYRLRKTLAHRWVRFHSLPDAQRYPDDDAAVSALLKRQNRLATEVLGEGESCWLFASRAPDDPIAGGDDALANYDWAEAFRWLDPENDIPDQPTITFAAECLWFSGRADDLLLQLANWQQSRILWASQSTGAVLAPYDGGVDIFMGDGQDVANLRRRHQDWLSLHPSGL